jgi:hypothetical protein
MPIAECVVFSFHDAIAECVVFSSIVQFQECVVFFFMMQLRNYHVPFSVFMMQIAESVGFLLHDAIFSLLIRFAAPAQASFVCLLLLDNSKYFRALEEEEDELGKGNIGFRPSFLLQVWMAQVLDFFYTMNHWLGQTLSLFTLLLNSFFFPKSRV